MATLLACNLPIVMVAHHNLVLRTFYKAPPLVDQLAFGEVYDGVVGENQGDLPAARHLRDGVICGNGTLIGNLRVPLKIFVYEEIEYDSPESPAVGSYTPDLPAADELKINTIRGVGDPGGPVIGTYPGEPHFPPQAAQVSLAPIPQRAEVSLA